MNPNTTIRPWILACGKQFGIRRAYEYRWADKNNNPLEIHATYRLTNMRPELANAVQNFDTASSYTAVQKGSQTWLTDAVIDLYNSQDGLYELSSFCVALKNHATVEALFEDKAALYEYNVEDLTDFDDQEIRYHHRLNCTFRETVVHVLNNANGVVETIRLQLDDGTYFDQYDIDDTGYTPTT